MRNWKHVTMGYDSLVFDLSLSGQYRPLISLNTNTINYPAHNSFGLHTVVGTPYPNVGEAINVLPAVIGASLVGIDKSSQNGDNWVLMCEEFFNRRPEENVYLNLPATQSGDDWWYATMPNVFFYQLYCLYPNTGDFNFQFRSVADRWLAAVKAMGGRDTAWHVPQMNYRGWYLSTMQPHSTGVPEPDAAGAIGWLLYNAYVETGEPKYRIGAEWALEFLNGRTTNPSYELQLPYGVYIAARMNAELGTTYDIENMIKWCFDIGPLRNWGTLIGTWGGIDCHGLVGESMGNDYAFVMNSIEQVGALVPLVRYDDRFARAVGKWVLNAANAIRLFYPNYLPDDHQDSEEWGHQYDPHSYIAHEALRESRGIVSPFATGDAIVGGWGATNLALYGSSHVGILGGIIDTTNVPMILKLDVLKTDYFHDPAYQSYLYFNPYGETKSIELDVGAGAHDLYDAVSNTIVATGVSGVTSFDVPADAAMLVVIAPAGGTVAYDLDRTLINGIVVDYRSGQSVANHPPRIKSLAAVKYTALHDENVRIYCTAADKDNDTLSYAWIATGGNITGGGAGVLWTAPDSTGVFYVRSVVTDTHGASIEDSVTFTIVDSINHAPVISGMTARPGKIDLEATSELTCLASDPDSDQVTFTWSASQGSITGSGPVIAWSAPPSEGNYFVVCRVQDGRGGQVMDSVGVVVRDFSNNQTGQLVAHYRFSGNAQDESGFSNHGTVSGAMLVSDRFGQVAGAYSFDGVDDRIQVPNAPVLSFQSAITISFWMVAESLYAREAYPLSHGNWENRWKVSISDKRVRWTVKTDAGIRDLDSRLELVTGTLYHVVLIYSGSDFEIHVDGELDAFATWSGSILVTSIDLTIGQVLPNNQGYNFKGVLDDIRIFDYALSVTDIQALYHEAPPSKTGGANAPVTSYSLHQNHPNPFNPTTTIRFQMPQRDHVILRVFDLLGREMRTLARGFYDEGIHEIEFHSNGLASGVYYYTLTTPAFHQGRKMVLLR
jgi:hypothetical protein